MTDEPADIDDNRRALSDHLQTGRRLRLAGDFGAAATLLRLAVADGEARLGPAAPELAVLLNELGVVGKYSGDFTEAEQAYQRALAIEDRHDNGDKANTAAILHNLAGLAHARGAAWTALPLALRGIEIRTSLPDPDPHGLAEDRAALAAILVDLGRHDDARTILNQTLNDGASRHDVAIALHNLGSMEFREGNLGAATATLRKALAVKSAELGRHHPDLAVTLHNLACCHQKSGRRRRARRCLERAIAILENSVTADHPTLAACRQKLSAPDHDDDSTATPRYWPDAAL